MMLRTRWDAGDQIPLAHRLLLASPSRCHAFVLEPTMNSKAEQLWLGMDPAGPFVVIGFSAGAFPLSLLPCCSSSPSPSLWHIFDFSVYQLIHFIWVLFFPLLFRETQEASGFIDAKQKPESMGWEKRQGQRARHGAGSLRPLSRNGLFCGPQWDLRKCYQYLLR